MNYSENRIKFVEWTKQQLIGNGVYSIKGAKPLDTFFTGFLFPLIENKNSNDFQDDDIDDEIDQNNLIFEELNEGVKVERKKRRYLPPSSAGFSFFLVGDELNIRVYYNAVKYNLKEKREKDSGRYKVEEWEKNPYSDGQEILFSLNGVKQYEIFDGDAKLDSVWRKYKDGYIVTITMSNTQSLIYSADRKKYLTDKNEKTLFEVELKAIVKQECVGIYPSKERELLTDEEKEIELRYKDIKIYAVGHGTAVNWLLSELNEVEIYTDFVPTVEVPQLTADTANDDSKVLRFSFLKNCNSDSTVITELKTFLNNYEKWIQSQILKAKHEDNDDIETADKIIERQIEAKSRINKGIILLENDESARIAFTVANEAMLKQMIAADKKNSKQDSFKWRPFQLAFILMVLESVANENSDFRDVLDLIWFPTGGGKTEAYLGLMAFLFIYRRIKYPHSSGGTVSIMRYTLRLLSSQQFIRATRVVFALELIRRKNQNKFGKEPITVGLWVGSSNTPNLCRDCLKIIEKEQLNKLLLDSCPWCGTKFSQSNFISTENDFHFTCNNKNCEFGKEKNNELPCNVVDEMLYKSPPTLLIATVDKFANFTWDERSNSFWGQNGNRPPELIIQDELHLISSALGSIVGLYEVAIDTVIYQKGITVKYIASTATIKNAKKQVQCLFARDVSIFPPPGLRYNDSYFAKTIPIKEKPGRLYIGYLAPLLDRQHCLEPLAGILLAVPNKLFHNNLFLLDAWWTQIIYHSSLKSIGNSRTLYKSGVREYLKGYTLNNIKEDIKLERPDLANSIENSNIDYLNEIKDNDVVNIIKRYTPLRYLDIKVKTLTSNNTADQNAKIFNQLVHSKTRGETVVIDVTLATNMISVGLDVSRLALMVINGQPLSTAEYIQASSRVGRGEVPGIVFTNYYKTQARSLSHYENFRSYHDSFYRFVEPSSLTPFTYQARTRALHAVLVITMRHSGLDLLENDSAFNLDIQNENVKKVIKYIKSRCSRAIGENELLKEKTALHIDEIVEKWISEIEFCKNNKTKLNYSQVSNDKSSQVLLCDFDKDNGVWQTLRSMRNVEHSAFIKINKYVGLNENEE